ncbi:hypothetical protein Poly21_28460 [Allorhodopirellula heiligendammensis]|uniref:Uncharacterized protein n=1 Tax=Allorhodopirellula heiligendammensis TaxID=2714739 RepID=A0A5C6BYF9_9BACT|nr:hypothetical protein Poly21_28460 [Allorhodopirellula heiligendammensis]
MAACKRFSCQRLVNCAALPWDDDGPAIFRMGIDSEMLRGRLPWYERLPRTTLTKLDDKLPSQILRRAILY